jgi:hypothetical protein
VTRQLTKSRDFPKMISVTSISGCQVPSLQWAGKRPTSGLSRPSQSFKEPGIPCNTDQLYLRKQLMLLATALKWHGNEADFWGFCRNWFLIDLLHYLSSRSDFGFEFAEIFIIEKWAPRLGESAFECLKENSASQRVSDSPTRQVGESLWWVGESLLKFFKIYHHFKRLNQPLKRSIWQKRS